MGSGSNSNPNYGPKRYHLIFLIDESGSMSNSWESVVKTFDMLVEPYKNSKPTNQILYSIILFDN